MRRPEAAPKSYKPGAAKFFVREIGKTGHFCNLYGGAPQAGHQKAKMQGNQGPKGQNARK